MTVGKGATKNDLCFFKSFRSLILLLCTMSFGLLFSSEAGEYVKEGMKISVGCVLPSSFPFMIISDFYVSYGAPENIRPLRRLFTSSFGFAPSDLAPFICGNVGGFPIGAKLISEKYEMGMISKEDAERLIPLCNNPSCAFIVGGIGLGMYKDLKIGIALLLSVYLSTVICGIITKTKRKESVFAKNNIRQNYNFTLSVKNAGYSCIGIISFISIFSVMIGIIKKRLKSALLLYLFSAFSEVTNAVNLFSSDTIFPPVLSLSMSAFSLGFGGVCVGMQSSVFTLPSGLSMRKYYPIKLLEGIISAAIFSILFSLMI